MNGKQARHARRAQQQAKRQAERQRLTTQLASPLPEDLDAALWFDPKGQEAIHTVLLDELERLRVRMEATLDAALDAAEKVEPKPPAGKVFLESWDLAVAEANAAHELSYVAWQRALMACNAEEVSIRLFGLITALITQDASRCFGEACGQGELPCGVALPWGLCPTCAYAQYADVRTRLLDYIRSKARLSEDGMGRRLAKVLVTHPNDPIPFCEALGYLVLTVLRHRDPHDRSYSEAVIARVMKELALPKEAVGAIEADWKSLTSRQRAARQCIQSALRSAFHETPDATLKTEAFVPAIRKQLGGGDKLLNDTLTLAAGGADRWRLRAYHMLPLVLRAHPTLTRERYLEMSPPLQQLLYVMATFVSSVRM